MRNQWRLLLLRRHYRSQPHISRHFFHCHFQVQSAPTFRSFSSPLHPHTPHENTPLSFTSLSQQSPKFRCFSSSELAVEHKDTDYVVILTDIFSNASKTNDEMKLELESNNIIISHELVLRVLENLNTSPDVAKRFFDWVSEFESERLSSKSYNLMLGILGANGLVEEFWDRVGIMEKKGYGVSKSTYNRISVPDVARRFSDWVLESGIERLSSKSHDLMLRILGLNGFAKEFWDMVGVMEKKGYRVPKDTCDRVLEAFHKKGLDGDEEKLREFIASGSMDDPIDNVYCSEVSKVIRQRVWGDDVEKRLRELVSVFSSDLIAMVLENLVMEPNKALIFFRWVEESGLFKHDERTYNAMAKVLGREDCIEKFWRVVDEMRGAGYELERGTYVKILGLFVERKMIKDAVDLYEFAMGAVNKPSAQDCTYLLKKIVVAKELNMDLFSRVVRVFKESGNVLKDTTLDALLKSLTSVGRLGEFNKILKAMVEGGLLPSGTLQSKIAFQLSSSGKTDEASEFVDNTEASGCNPNHKMWASLVEGHCVAGDLDKASDYFQKMVEKEVTSYAGYALENLVNSYCRKKRAIDACKLLSDVVNQKELKPWHTTYKVLVSKLLIQGGFKEALNLLGLMKNQGYPPFLDPFVEYISKIGTADDAAMFLKAMTVKRFPSNSVYLRVFEAYFKAGRHNEAQDFLCKCPRYIRNHPDVLNLFCSMSSSRETAAAIVVAA